MKKSFVTFLALIALSTGASAFAGGILPAVERPILKAAITEIDADGHELGIGLDKELSMNERGFLGDATSFRFAEDSKVVCATAPCPAIKNTIIFVVKNKEVTRCGSTKYTALEFRPVQNAEHLNSASRQLVVLDHSTRLCEDYKKFRWEARMITPAGHGLESRNLYGNPSTVEVESQLPRNLFN